ncbi:MAG: ferric reductase-like transmembrane domain-containing protein [Planctomycetes bacterium]|nr:ferric reductase-like transmembrane domain-containing protein [Planctomycetota bacterium]
MSQRFVAVQWNRRKLVYDLLVVGALLVQVALFELIAHLTIEPARRPNPQVLAMRAWGSTAFLLLAFILAIGPLARLFPGALKPFLYNRRHLGVVFFLTALWHAREVLGFYLAYGKRSPLAEFVHWSGDLDGPVFPFELFGLGALAIFALLAATSHDFWQRRLGPRRWKWLHMSIYAAYLLVAAHLAGGALRDGASILHRGLVLGVMTTVGLLQISAAIASGRGDRSRPENAGWLAAGPSDRLEEGRPVGILGARGERIALVRHDGRISALSAVCAHQGGPLDEGRVLDGCLTCPWHGWQYRPADGCSPPPFEERVASHQLRLDALGRLEVRLEPEALDAPARPIVPPLPGPDPEPEDFFVGYLPMTAGQRRRSLRLAGAAIVLFLVLGLLLSWSQSRGGPTLEPSRPLALATGIYRAAPYPHLVVRNEDGSLGTILLVSAGKSASGLGADLEGRPVAIADGELLSRDRSRMIAGGTARAALLDPDEATALAAAGTEELGAVTLEGEIVDSKCYFGAMRPGRGQIHRACAQMCIEGGIPPILATTGPDGEEWHVLLVDLEGRAVNEKVLDQVAVPMRISGRLWRRAGQLHLTFDADQLVE